LHCSVAYSEG